MRGIDGKRGQHREDLGHEALFEPGAIFGREVAGPDDGNAGLRELLHQDTPRHLLVPHELAGAAIDGLELLRRRQAVLAGRGNAGQHLRLEPGDAHHVELVEIVGRDRQKAQPLQQRMARAVRFGEDPLVEGEPGELPVDETRRRLKVDRRCRGA
jgi:hypothetical protein